MGPLTRFGVRRQPTEEKMVPVQLRPQVQGRFEGVSMFLSGLTHSLPWGRPQVSGNCLSTVTGLGQSWLWGRFRGLQICQPPGTRCGTLQSPPQPYEEGKFSGQPPRHPSRPDSGCPFPLPDTRGRLHVPALLRPSLGSTRPGPPGTGTPRRADISH